MPPTLESRFRVMGGAAHLVVVGGTPAMVDGGRARLDDLERRWSRFLEDSEVSRLNRAGGQPCRVSAETVTLVERAVTGWAATEGVFDPTVLPAIRAVGYTCSFESMPGTVHPDPAQHLPGPAPGCAGIIVEPESRLVLLPHGTEFDPGGIGKGLAADLVAEELIAAGASGVCVNVGGDIRASGVAPTSDGWIVAVEDPFDSSGRSELDRVRLHDGAIATSSVLLKAWQSNGRRVHHLIDPATGLPTDSTVVAATVLTGAAWWAEVMTKAALMAGAAAIATLERHGAEGLVVTGAGESRVTDGFARFRCSELAGHP